jgi:phosphoribosylglycinamide formyltransferase-1
MPLRIAALASGRGSNLQALLDACADGRIDGRVVVVGSDKPACGALQVAAAAGVPALALDPRGFSDRRAFDVALFDAVAAAGVDLLVMAGYMRIIDAGALAAWSGRAINIHPSLLPLYRGLHTHRQALAAGDAAHGASVHFVTAELDGGPVVAQCRIAVEAADTEASLARRLLAEEHRLLPAVVQAIAAGRIRLKDGAVYDDGKRLPAPLQLDADGRLRNT